ncbi:MAG TPA: hypothetical protein VHW23_36975 [Kofleriaceae bacterium]|nr:hypothetical protein [Kofleriaceae bacterium]
MKNKRNEKLNQKAARVLIQELDAKALDGVTGGTTPIVGPGGCRTCGILVTTDV